MPRNRAKPAIKPNKPRPKKSSVHTMSPPLPPPLPLRHWAVDHRQAQGLLAHSLEDEIAIMRRLGIWHERPLPSWHYEDGISYDDCWHIMLAERDETLIAAQARAIADNNSTVASLANGLDLDVRRFEAEEGSTRAHVLQFDPLAMARRIEAAAANHKNKDRGKRGHKAANRHLKYSCPVCNKPARCASSSRILICAGEFDAPHTPTPMAFDESSQPSYRLDDKYAGNVGAEDVDLSGGIRYEGDNRTQSQVQLEARKKQAAGTAQSNAAPRNEEIPF